MKKHFNITVKGKVQGVFYRASTEKKANELRVKGKVKNLPNGDVYIEAEGDEEKLSNFLAWCKQGPSQARVEKIEVNEGKLKNYLSLPTFFLSVIFANFYEHNDSTSE
ncbi:MAG TPA: acylphosphatase [Cytophagales bacterium]|nr:acylphosphatase [Cytophagales bacterium]